MKIMIEEYRPSKCQERFSRFVNKCEFDEFATIRNLFLTILAIDYGKLALMAFID